MFVCPCIITVQFNVCMSVHHHSTIQINHHQMQHFIILKFIYSSTCFGRFPAHHQELSDSSGSPWFYLRIVVIVVLCSWSNRPARPRTQHCYHHDTKVKPGAATAVAELLMMGGETPETCWAVNKRQDNKLENYCIWLMIYLKYKRSVEWLKDNNCSRVNSHPFCLSTITAVRQNYLLLTESKSTPLSLWNNEQCHI